MPDIEGQEIMLIKTGDDNVPYQFYAPPCSSQSANDGAIPFGTNVASAEIVTKDDDGTVVEDLVDGALSVSANVITQNFKYPGDSGAGRYSINLALTLDNDPASVINFMADRIIVEDI